MNFSDGILSWYQTNKRDLPWRGMKDPYKIWVSEIILQQTRVDQGIPYYFRFIQQFPDISILSQASEQMVLNVWKGLGYYSRARNMHYTAHLIMKDFGGIFPANYNSLIKLKGIGPYTSAAIASICNDEIIPAIDGNVTRVLSRYFGISELIGSTLLQKKIKWISEQLMPAEAPGDYNQAMMEFGAMICTPFIPKCDTCMFQQSCYAFKNDMVGVLPTKKKTIKKRLRYLNYFHLITPDGKVAIKQRKEEDIWKNLWEFPLIESEKLIEADKLTGINIENFIKSDELRCSFTKDVVHILSHQILHVRFFTIYLNDIDIIDQEHLVLINPDDNNYPFPRLIEKFLKTN